LFAGILNHIIDFYFVEIISEFNLTNVIKEPTRNGALLDPIIVSNLDIVIDSEVIRVSKDISDHDVLLTFISLRFIFLQRLISPS
jgi:hypothetical protein